MGIIEQDGEWSYLGGPDYWMEIMKIRVSWDGAKHSRAFRGMAGQGDIHDEQGDFGVVNIKLHNNLLLV